MVVYNRDTRPGLVSTGDLMGELMWELVVWGFYPE